MCRGKPVYHTNVMMAIGTDVAVVCAESVTDDKERQHLLVSTSSCSPSCCLEFLQAVARGELSQQGGGTAGQGRAGVGQPGGAALHKMEGQMRVRECRLLS
jgi:hypothetical protein